MSALTSFHPPHLDQAARSRWAELAGRAGYVTRGVVFGVTGVLALLGARGVDGVHPDPLGAIAAMAHAPWGRAAVLLVAIGLFTYGAWSLAQATLDPARRGRRPKAIAARVGYGLSAIFYAPLAWSALHAAIRGGVERTAHRDAVELLASSGGRAMLGAIGGGVVCAAIVQLVVGVAGTFREELDLSRASRSMRWVTVALGVVGFVARGLVFAIVGGFLIDAAVYVDPSRAHSIAGAIREVLRVPYGSALVSAIGVGLLVFGAFSLLAARFHRAPR